jgi:hypothetical protein
MIDKPPCSRRRNDGGRCHVPAVPWPQAAELVDPVACRYHLSPEERAIIATPLDEAPIQAVFAAWLADQGWTVKAYAADKHLDLYAERNGERLMAEVKGKTSDPGADADVVYGQILRRMPAVDDLATQFAVVIPALHSSINKATRVNRRVRDMLRITIYGVAEDGAVRIVTNEGNTA